MSTTVRSYGVIAILDNPLSVEQREYLEDKFYDAKSDLGTNYEGTLIYLDLNRNKSYRDREELDGLFLGRENLVAPSNCLEILRAEAEKYSLGIDTSNVDTYNCIWYNGSDSPLANLTLEEFKARSLGH